MDYVDVFVVKNTYKSALYLSLGELKDKNDTIENKYRIYNSDDIRTLICNFISVLVKNSFTYSMFYNLLDNLIDIGYAFEELPDMPNNRDDFANFVYDISDEIADDIEDFLLLDLEGNNDFDWYREQSIGRYITIVFSGTFSVNMNEKLMVIIQDEREYERDSTISDDKNFVDTIYIDSRDKFEILIYKLIVYTLYFGLSTEKFWLMIITLAKRFDEFKYITGIPKNKEDFRAMLDEMAEDALDNLLDFSDEVLDDLDAELERED